jgi:hypothetical protein
LDAHRPAATGNRTLHDSCNKAEGCSVDIIPAKRTLRAAAQVLAGRSTVNFLRKIVAAAFANFKAGMMKSIGLQATQSS